MPNKRLHRKNRIVWRRRIAQRWAMSGTALAAGEHTTNRWRASFRSPGAMLRMSVGSREPTYGSIAGFQSRHDRVGRASIGDVVRKNSLAANEVGMEVRHNQVVGLSLRSFLDATHRVRALQAMQHHSGIEMPGLAPAFAANP